MTSQLSPDLENLFDQLLGDKKLLMYEQIGRKLPHHFRFNPLKGDLSAQRAFFEEQGFRFHGVEGQDNIFQIDFQPYPIGKSLSHFLGHIYVQDLASMIPPLALQPEPNDWVLDMSAAPGSKTTQMGAMMNNTGVILANDVVAKRLRALSKNIERMSMYNTIVNQWFGEQYGNAYYEQFDKVLLDPACSGLGTLHKNPEILGWWTPKHCERLSSGQRNLMVSAIKALRPGGVLLYSTCTLTPEENEDIVQFALDEFPMAVESVEIPGLKTWPGLSEFGDKRYHPDIQKTIRLYPFDRATEGFYVARLRKLDSLDKPPHPSKQQSPRHHHFLSHRISPVKKSMDYLMQHFDIPEKVLKRFRFLIHGEKISFCTRDFEQFPIIGKPKQIGTNMARTLDRVVKLNSGGTHLLGPHAQRSVIDLSDLESLQKFVNREAVALDLPHPGQHIIRYKGLTIGYGILDKGKFKSQFPKGEWPFQLIGDWEEKEGE